MRGRAGQPDSLQEGSELGGLVLRSLIACDEFCSLWATQPAKGDLSDVCLRAIPMAQLHAPDAYERLLDEVAFWQDLSGRCAVDLYDCSLARGHCLLVMRYLQDGSAADWLQRGSGLADRLESFALDFASALRELHTSASAHGNLKPSNVFPLADGGVLLSDFAIPLWADELDQGCEALRPRLVHPYQDAQQRHDVRDFDTRSDVYAFAHILLRCLSGVDPDPEGEPAPFDGSRWPRRLGSVVEKCLAQERSARPADGFELFDMLSSAAVFVAGKGPAPGGAAAADAAIDVPSLLEEARALTQKGALGSALDILESLPAGTEGLDALLDEVARRHKACEALVQEAVSLAGMGKLQAAAETVAEAEKLWADSETAMAVKADLAAAAGEDEALLAGKLPQAIREALEEQRYPVARSHLERLIRQGHINDEVLGAIERFKKGRVRKAFLDSIASARRLYVLGHHREAAQQWMDAARWLPGGPERDRLRRVAAAATRSKLNVDVRQLGLDDVREETTRSAPEPAPSEAALSPGRQAGAAAGATPAARRLRTLGIALAAVLIGCVALLILWALLSD